MKTITIILMVLTLIVPSVGLAKKRHHRKGHGQYQKHRSPASERKKHKKKKKSLQASKSRKRWFSENQGL